MTQPNPATKTRADVAHLLTARLITDGGRADFVLCSLSIASLQLSAAGFRGDYRWLCEHTSHVSGTDAAGLTALAHRLIERLTIEGGQAIDDVTSRTVDTLTRDVAAHLAQDGGRRAVAARLSELGTPQLATLLANALVRLAGVDKLVDELHQAKAKLRIEKAKGDQAAVVSA